MKHVLYTSNNEIINLFKSIDGEKDNKNVISVKQDICKKMLFLVYRNCKKYRKYPNYEDIIQDGFVGLLKAINKFDYKRFPNFFIYAEQWVINYIKKSASHFDIVYNPRKVRVVYSDLNENDYDPNDSPEIRLINEQSKYNIRAVVNGYREHKIINHLFGLSEQKSLRAVGGECGITHERVRQIKNNIIEKLKNNKILADISF